MEAHDVAAHIAAGNKESADLIEEKLAGLTPRPTRTFEERESPFRALPDDELRAALAKQVVRKLDGLDELAALGENEEFAFTGTTMTAGRLLTHTRSEAAIHRWDLVGDDQTSSELLAQPDLTRHAVSLLNSMPVLLESSVARAKRADVSSLRVLLRSPDQADVCMVVQRDAARFELLDEGTGQGDALITTDPVNRLLTIWGRRSSGRAVTMDAEAATAASVERLLWPDAVSWPPAGSKPSS